jgi:hypothetical protein
MLKRRVGLWWRVHYSAMERGPGVAADQPQIGVDSKTKGRIWAEIPDD